MLSISSSATVSFFCLQSFPASGSFPMSWFFTSGGQNIRASVSALCLQRIFRLISFRIDQFHPKDTQESSLATQFKSIYSMVLSLLLGPALIYIHQFGSNAQSCPNLCDPMDCSMPGLPVQQQRLEPTQTHVHRVSDAIQQSHPLSSPSPPAFNLCQAPGSFPISLFFPSGGQSIGVSASTSVLPMNIQDYFLLGLIGWISLQSKGLSRVFPHTTGQKYQFFGAQLSLQSKSHIHI